MQEVVSLNQPRAFAVMLLAFAALRPAAAADLAAVKQRGVLRVLAVQLHEPDEFFQFSGAPGFDREILEGFARLQSVRLEPVPVSAWDDLVPALAADRGDVVAGRFTVTEERKRRIAFTRETFPTRNVVLTRQPTPRVRSLEELRVLRVGTVKGSSMAEAVAQTGVPPANVDDGIRPGGLPQALVSGRVKAVVLGVESAITAQRDDPRVELGAFVGPPGSLAFGVRRGDDQLLAALDRYIQNLRRTATWNRLAVKYFGDQAPEVLRKARE
jgi:ABC-type amino acid transport substrate-binding protein